MKRHRMKRHSKIVLAALAVIAAGGAALTAVAAAGAHEGWRQGHGGHGHGPRGAHMFKLFDTDGDGRLTQAEIDQVLQERLARFDTDGNGALDLEEYEALWVDAMREHMVDRFQMHDNDGDGLVTRDEFTSRFGRMVEYMDRDDDGVIDESDMGRRYRDDD